MKYFIKQLLPPVLLGLIKKLSPYGWKGNYKTWSEAQAKSSGYDSDLILDKVRKSLLKVKNGEAVYERDSVIFDEIQYSWPLLTGLMFCYTKEQKLSVVDFGGSLGSTYYQNKNFLDKLDNVSWNIVEQKHFVDVGKQDFIDERLQFYCNITEIFARQNPNILVLSSVLQYLEDPYAILDELLKYNFKSIVIDRTPFSLGDEKIALQIVPPKIYKASYPCRFFNKNEFLNYFKSKDYQIIEQFEGQDGKNNEYEFLGFILEKNA